MAMIQQQQSAVTSGLTITSRFLKGEVLYNLANEVLGIEDFWIEGNELDLNLLEPTDNLRIIGDFINKFTYPPNRFVSGSYSQGDGKGTEYDFTPEVLTQSDIRRLVGVVVRGSGRLRYKGKEYPIIVGDAFIYQRSNKDDEPLDIIYSAPLNIVQYYD
jgi:hypothetical protein